MLGIAAVVALRNQLPVCMIVDLGMLAQVLMKAWAAQWLHSLAQATVVLSVAQGLTQSYRKTGLHCYCSRMGLRVVALGIGIDPACHGSHAGRMGLAAGKALVDCTGAPADCIEASADCTGTPADCTESSVGCTDPAGHGSRMLVADGRMLAVVAAAVHTLQCILRPALVMCFAQVSFFHSRLAGHKADCTGLGW